VFRGPLWIAVAALAAMELVDLSGRKPSPVLPVPMTMTQLRTIPLLGGVVVDSNHLFAS
jgi:hypothetical protein